MLCIGMVDDEQDARFTLRCAVERCLDQAGIPYTIYEFSSADGFLAWQSKHANALDLVFLDIEMQGTNGMEAAVKIRDTSAGLSLVFMTGYVDYVFDGYSVGALDYLTKPLDHQRLASVLSRVQALIYQQEPVTYTVQNADGFFRIKTNSILYLMSDRRQVILVTKERRFPFYAKLDDVESQLDCGFVRLHRRYLANVRAIDSMAGDTVLIGEESLPVSRSQKATVINAVVESVVSKEK